MKPFLVLQLRPETEASDDEFRAILRKGDLAEDEVTRIRLDREDLSADLALEEFSGVIVGGGPGCVSDAPEDKSEVEARAESSVLGLMPEITTKDLPFLGCCYGIGVLGHHLGAEVSKRRYSEPVGATPCQVTAEGAVDPILEAVPRDLLAFVGHKEALQELPEGCVHLMASKTCPFQMIRFGKNVYATQFHPEADSAGFEVRVRIYKNKGYFPPEDADRIIEMCWAADVKYPERILKNFVARYRA